MWITFIRTEHNVSLYIQFGSREEKTHHIVCTLGQENVGLNGYKYIS